MAAPVEYEPRDFILYLFGELCRRVPGVQGDEDTNPAASEERVSPSPLRIFLAAALAAAVLSLGVAARLIAELLHDHTSLWPLISVSLGVVLVLLALMMSYGRRVLRPPFRRDPFIDDRVRATGNQAKDAGGVLVPAPGAGWAQSAPGSAFRALLPGRGRRARRHRASAVASATRVFPDRHRGTGRQRTDRRRRQRHLLPAVSRSTPPRHPRRPGPAPHEC